MDTTSHFPYHFIIKSFDYNNVSYRVALTPVLYAEEDGLDFTGAYIGILISSEKGTKMFEMHPGSDLTWKSKTKGMDPVVVALLGVIVQENRDAKLV